MALKKERETDGLHSMSSSPLKISNSPEKQGDKPDGTYQEINGSSNSSSGSSGIVMNSSKSNNMERKTIEKSKSVAPLRLHSAFSSSSSPSAAGMGSKLGSFGLDGKYRGNENSGVPVRIENVTRAADVLGKVRALPKLADYTYFPNVIFSTSTAFLFV